MLHIKYSFTCGKLDFHGKTLNYKDMMSLIVDLCLEVIQKPENALQKIFDKTWSEFLIIVYLQICLITISWLSKHIPSVLQPGSQELKRLIDSFPNEYSFCLEYVEW